MRKPVEIFDDNIERARALHALHLNFSNLVAPIVDLSDLLRTEIVLVVSALDQFIHATTRLRMMEIWHNQRPSTPAYLRFSISLDATSTLASNPTLATALESEIRERHSYLSFQQPDKIADAMRLVSTAELWKEVGAELGQDPAHIKSQLSLVVDRRNKIAHEADIDPTYPGQRWPITRVDTELATSFIESVGHAIDKVTS